MSRMFILFTLLSLFSKYETSGTLNENLVSCYSNSNPASLMHDGINREYLLYIPDSYDSKIATPLMLNFHGFGGSASEYMQYADMRALAERESFILVYPQGSCLNNYAHWNPCPPGGDNKSSADDVGFITAMIDEISSVYAVDKNRIYAAGYSNGGMMAYGLANYKSELIAAVASVSGVMLDCTSEIKHPMPVIHLHGTSDQVIPYDGNDYYNSAQEVIDHWAVQNNTNPSPITTSSTSSGMTIEHTVYEAGDDNTSVEHYKFIGGNHVWFDASYEGMSTGELIWNFVKKYDANGLR